jgi:hypothetical protein
VKLQYISTNEHIAYILTKPLMKEKFVYFINKIGVVENASLDKREWWRIPPSLRGSVDVFISIERYSHIGLGVEHVRIFVGTHIAILFL